MILRKRDGHHTIIRSHRLEFQDVLHRYVGLGRCFVFGAERLAIAARKTPGHIGRPHFLQSVLHTVGPGPNDLSELGLEVTALHPRHRLRTCGQMEMEPGLVSLAEGQMVVQDFRLKPADQRLFDGASDLA